jgi:MFS family permease
VSAYDFEFRSRGAPKAYWYGGSVGCCRLNWRSVRRQYARHSALCNIFDFSQITLTLVYAAYVLGNLAALLFFGRMSDEVGRRKTILPAMAIAIESTLIFLFARNVHGFILPGF